MIVTFNACEIFDSFYVNQNLISKGQSSKPMKFEYKNPDIFAMTSYYIVYIRLINTGLFSTGIFSAGVFSVHRITLIILNTNTTILVAHVFFIDWFGDGWISKVYRPNNSKKTANVNVTHISSFGMRYRQSRKLEKIKEKVVHREKRILER